MEATGGEASCDLGDHWMHLHPAAGAGTGAGRDTGDRGAPVPEDNLLSPRPNSAVPRDVPSLF